MKRVCLVVCLAILSASCGGGNGPGSQPPATLTSGNWTFQPSTLDPNQLIMFEASLTQSGSTVSGMAVVGLMNCVSLAGAVAVSGTISGNSISLKAGTTEVVTITGTISSAKSFVGTYSVTGSCEDGEHGSITGTYVPPLTGTWTATKVVDTTSFTMILHLTQQQTPSTEGYFPLAGIVDYAGSPCTTSGVIRSNVSFVLGRFLVIMVDTNEAGGSAGQILYTGFLDDPATATSFQGGDSVLSGSCSDSGQFTTFTKQ